MEITTANAGAVYQALVGQLEADGIPITSLMSVLTVSAAYMKGEHNGMQAKLKESAPHLLDIDGDACHIIHNAVKCFPQELDKDRWCIH